MHLVKNKMVYIKVHYREQKGYTIMDAWDINRVKQIMKERGMKPSVFYRDDNYGKDDEFVRLTKTRFHRVLRGVIKHTGDDFIPKFCKIAGISEEEFYDTKKEPDELTYLFDDKEKNLILTIRLVEKETGDKHIHAYLQGIVEGMRRRK